MNVCAFLSVMYGQCMVSVWTVCGQCVDSEQGQCKRSWRDSGPPLHDQIIVFYGFVYRDCTSSESHRCTSPAIPRLTHSLSFSPSPTIPLGAYRWLSPAIPQPPGSIPRVPFLSPSGGLVWGSSGLCAVWSEVVWEAWEDQKRQQVTGWKLTKLQGGWPRWSLHLPTSLHPRLHLLLLRGEALLLCPHCPHLR